MAGRDFAGDGRANKARALAIVLAADDDLVNDPQTVLRLSNEGWAAAAQIAHVKVPSEETRRMVPQFLQAIAEDRARNPDPFACFTTGHEPQGGSGWVTDDHGRLDDGYGFPREPVR